MPPREPDQIPLQEVPNIDGRGVPMPTITPPGTTGGFTPHPDHPDHIAALRTYSTDLADAIKEQQGSVVKIAIAEQEKNREEEETQNPTSKKNLTLLFASIITIVVAGLIVGGVIWYKNITDISEPVDVEAPSATIRTEEAGVLNITDMSAREIVRSVRGIVDDPGVRLGTMKNILITETIGEESRVTASEFLSALDTHAPEQFNRTLSDEFELGLYVFDHTNLFLVLEGSAYDYLLSGMLEWEPYLVTDFGPLFGVNTDAANVTITSTPFKDVLIQNRDTRAVLYSDGKPALFYTFLDQNTVVIAGESKTLGEIVRRFGTGK